MGAYIYYITIRSRKQAQTITILALFAIFNLIFQDMKKYQNHRFDSSRQQCPALQKLRFIGI